MSFQPSIFLHKLPEPVLYKLVLIPRANLNHRSRLNVIRKQNKAKIAFIMSSLPMWRIQGLYELLRHDSRFELIQAVYPFPTFSEDEQESAVNQILDYCRSNRMPYINLIKEKNPGSVLKQHIDPDILFYPQPYSNLYENDLDNQYFTDRLICYIPYAMLTAKEPWAYHTHLNNIAWRLYFQSEARKEEAQQILYNKGRNIRVVGELTADRFSADIASNPWKTQPVQKKKVIWAPHFSIIDEGHLHRDSFIRLSEAMWGIALHFQDRIQFAFKPHPRLASILYDLPEWGREKTNEYYKRWAEGSNTQLNTGDYIDLFKTSDAMIHDCSSFSVEYHYTGKPVLFMTEDITAVKKNLNELGRDAITAHYQGRNADDARYFLKEVVLSGADPMADARKEFKKNYLTPPFGRTVAKNIYQDLLSSLRFEK